VAVRAIGRDRARAHGHIADSVAVPNTAQHHLRRSDPVTSDCVTGFWRQNKRLQKPSAVSVGHTWARSASRGICGGLDQMASDLHKYHAGYTAGTREDDQRLHDAVGQAGAGTREHGHMADRSRRVPAVRHTARYPGLRGVTEVAATPVGAPAPGPW
jgi:hypothetical protein